MDREIVRDRDGELVFAGDMRPLSPREVRDWAIGRIMAGLSALRELGEPVRCGRCGLDDALEWTPSVPAEVQQ